MGKYFTIKELIASDTAKERKIDNTPGAEILQHLEELINSILDPIRERYGSAIRVNSGYRCPALNAAVGGVSTSAHLTGYGVDISPVDGDTKKLFRLCEAFLPTIGFDQLLYEKNSKGSIWVHIGYKGTDGRQRRQIKSLNVK